MNDVPIECSTLNDISKILMKLCLITLFFITSQVLAARNDWDVTPRNASDYMISVEVQEPHDDIKCTDVSIKMKSGSGGNGIKDVYLGIPDILGDQEIFLNLEVFDEPEWLNAGYKRTSACLPRELLEKATIRIAYGVPQALCTGDVYTIRLAPFIANISKN